MTTEKKAQIAAMNAKGMTVEEISKATGVNYTDVEVFIATRPNPETRASKPREEYHRMTTKERAKIIELSDSGIKQADISRQLGIPRSTVSRVLIDAGKSTRAKSTEKEPASAATDTSSEVKVHENLSTSKDTTKRTESQALSGISGLSYMESALDEWLGLGQEAKIVSLRADQTDSELVFEHKGEKYIMAFGGYEE